MPSWTSPRTWVALETVTAALLNQHVRDNLKALGDAWTAYTPVWTGAGGNPAIGNGTIVGAYMSTGKLTHFRIILTLGSTTTVGTGVYSWSLPVTALYTANSTPVGTCTHFDTSASGRFAGIAALDSSTTVGVWSAGSGAARFAATVNVVPANGDVISIAGTYEAA